MSDISKLINEAIEGVISEAGKLPVGMTMKEAADAKEAAAKEAEATADAKAKGVKKLAQINKMVNPKKAWEDLKDSRAVEQAALQKESDFKNEHPILHAGSKVAKTVKDKAEEVADSVKEHPYLSAATAAALAAGAGGLAAVKKMRKAAKKK